MEQITAAEWNILECLWEKSPRTCREAVAYLEASVGWSRSTTLTMLRRMTAKGLVSCRESGGIKVFEPLIGREDATKEQTQSFLDRVYHGSISMMLSAFTKKETLTQAELDALYAILEEVKPTG